MKAILMSIRPEWVAKILNGEKTIEIRKKFPKDYVGWVYIYVTKGKDRLVWDIDGHICIDNEHYAYGDEELNGKVVARFWCDKVEEIVFSLKGMETKSLNTKELLKSSCLTNEQLENYLPTSNGKAIHITKLEIFDKPKEIGEFRKYCDKHFNWWTNKCLGCKAYTPDTDIEDYCNKNKLSLTRAPESWCYVEI